MLLGAARHMQPLWPALGPALCTAPILSTRAVGLVILHSAYGKSKAWEGDKAVGKTEGQDLGPGHQTADTPRGTPAATNP